MRKKTPFIKSLFESGSSTDSSSVCRKESHEGASSEERKFPVSSKPYGTFAALDIGTDKVSCSIGGFQTASSEKVSSFSGEDFSSVLWKGSPGMAMPSITLLGFGQRASKGVTLRGVSDLEALQGALLNAVYTAEEMSQQNIKEVYVNIPASWARTQRIVIRLSLSSPSPIQPVHLRKLFYTARNRTLEGNPYIVHLWPLSYQLDDLEAIQDPIGMIGKDLSVTCLAVTVSRTLIQNLSHCIGQCTLDVAGVAVDPYAAGLACLTQDEAELGATLVDIGGQLTQVACFHGGKLIGLGTAPLAGWHVTSDLARILPTSVAQAERIKTLYGNLESAQVQSAELVPFTPVGIQAGPNVSYVARKKISSIIRARVDEILECVEACLGAMPSEVDRIAFQKILLTGGASQLPGLIEVVQERWPGAKVRLAIQRSVDGRDGVVRSPAFSTAAGLLCCASRDYLGHPLAANDSKPLTFFQRLSLWLSDHM